MDEQYSSLLSRKCAGMGFARDFFQNLLPGQAGPRLEQFCSGTVVTPQGVGTHATSATPGFSAEGGVGETAVRRRVASEQGQEASPEQVLVAGSADSRDGLHASLRYLDETRNATRFEGGRHAQTIRLTVGVDRRVAASGVIGVAVLLEDEEGGFDAGGEFGHEGHGALLYGSWMPVPDAHVDIAAGVAFRNTRVRRIVSFERTFTPAPSGPTRVVESIEAAPVHSRAGHTELHASLQGGFDLRFGGGTVGPRLAAQYRRTDIEAALESGSTPMALNIAPQAVTSLRSAVGLQASRVFNTDSAVLMVQLGADWWHEFQDDQRFVTASFVEDLRAEPSILRFQTEPPDRDVFVALASLSVTVRGGWSGFMAVDALLEHAHQRRWSASLGLRKEL